MYVLYNKNSKQVIATSSELNRGWSNYISKYDSDIYSNKVIPDDVDYLKYPFYYSVNDNDINNIVLVKHPLYKLQILIDNSEVTTLNTLLGTSNLQFEIKFLNNDTNELFTPVNGTKFKIVNSRGKVSIPKISILDGNTSSINFIFTKVDENVEILLCFMMEKTLDAALGNFDYDCVTNNKSVILNLV